MNRLEISTVADIMQPVSTTVCPHDKIEAVSQLMNQRQIHSAPIVDQQGVCIGIITSTDLVRYAAIRSQLEHAANHGFPFDSARYQDGQSTDPNTSDSGAMASRSGYRFDEAGFLVVHPVESVSPQLSLLAASEMMVSLHRHHLLVLDSENHPVGILSTMDILKCLNAQ